MSRSSFHVAIAICTYKRPQFLERALQSLVKVDIPEGCAVTVIVVDNDQQGSAAKSVQASLGKSEISYIYSLTNERGIPVARNQAIEEALKLKADYLAFIDDDEIADKAWLSNLVRTMGKYSCIAVTGPKIPFFEKQPPYWMVQGKFFEKNAHLDGASLSCADTGNILFRMDAFADNLRFDETMLRSGGTDTKLTRTLTKAGHQIVWSSAAIVHDFIPESRMSVGWLCQRHFRNGLVRYKIERDLSGAKGYLKLFALMGYYGLKSIQAFCLGLFRGRYAFVRGGLYTAEACGILAGLLGIKYNEYDKIHGK